MRTATKTTALVLFTMIVATRFPAAEDAALTLQQARALALSRSAALQSAQLAVDSASLAARAQGYAALPSVSASAGGSYGYELGAAAAQSAGTWGASAKIAATQTLFDGGRTSELVKKYGFATEAARESLRSSRISLIGQVDAAFFAVLEARASIDAATGDLESAKFRQTIAQAKIDAGSLSKSAYLQTQADTAGYETSLLLARKTLASANAKLASLTGRSAAAGLEQPDFSGYSALLAKLSALDEAGIDKLAADIVAIAKANSPALSGYALALRQASSGVAVAKAAYAPTVAAGFSQGLSLAQDSVTGKLGPTAYPGSVSLTASMSLDLWNTRNAVESAQVASAEASLSASQGEADLELGIVQALYEWVSSAASIGSAAKALDYAQSNYDNVLERFKLSSATTSDLSAAEALVSTDKTALIAARYGFLSNLSTLRGLAGLEDATKLTEAVQ
jgi:outer membrane protein